MHSSRLQCGTLKSLPRAIHCNRHGPRSHSPRSWILRAREVSATLTTLSQSPGALSEEIPASRPQLHEQSTVFARNSVKPPITRRVSRKEELGDSDHVSPNNERRFGGALRRGPADLATFSSPKDAHHALLSVVNSRASRRDLLYIFSRAVQHPGYVETTLASFLNQVLAQIASESILSQYRSVSEWSLRYHGRSTLQDIVQAFQTGIEQSVPAVRRLELEQERLPKLKVLLRIAALIGNFQQAKAVFSVIQGLPEEKPDLECWNHLLEALCWNNAHSGGERFNLRVVPTYLQRRSSRNASIPGWTGYRTGSGGLKEAALEAIRELTEAGLTPNVDTYNSMLVAMGREGDLQGVKYILQSVWDVDVNTIMRGDGDAMLFENDLERFSSRTPTQRTLFAVAHVFAINNDMSAAYQVVDFISRKYNITIDTATWVHMMEWTFVLSTRRYGVEKSPERREQRVGQLPVRSVTDLWEAMRSLPYNVPLTMDIVTYLTRTSFRRRDFRRLLAVTIQGKDLALESFRRWKELPEGPEKDSAGFHAVVDRSRMQACVKLLLALAQPAKRRSRDVSHQQKRLRISIPNVLQCFDLWHPQSGAAYSTHTGRIQFHPWKSSVLIEEIGNGPSNTLMVAPSTQANSSPYKGDVRQARVQRRQETRTFTFRPAEYTPAWFETTDRKTTNQTALRGVDASTRLAQAAKPG